MPFQENNKWGYKKGNKVIIKPEYDSAYAFNVRGQLALVSNKNEFNKITNPLTGEEGYEYDYFYINDKNQRFKLLAENFPDSVSSFPDQQELRADYLDSSGVFKVLFQNKVYLLSKRGKQLSAGFDNIYVSRLKNLYVIENHVEVEKRIVSIKGLVNTDGKMIIKCKYKTITINREDSSIYCCSAVYTNKLNDDVYDIKGNLFYFNKKHIEFSSKTIHVYKTFEPGEKLVVENSDTKEDYDLEGSDFYYMKKNKALVINKESWYVIDLLSRKKQKVNKEDYFLNLLKIIE